ncbi:MAG: hypothetical protein HFJ57_00545 [Clostridia bacterium]|nr:hypothetical protein [Clostridia bacterium]
MIKVIIANDNDILYDSLLNVALEKGLDIEVTNVSSDKLNSLIYQIKTEEKVIILDSITSITFCINVLKNAINRIGKENIIILVVDSNNLNDVIYSKKHHHLLRKKHSDFSLLDIVTVVSDSVKNTMELEKFIDNILWKLGFTSYFKGTIYLKDAILLAYNDHNFLKDSNLLIKKVAEKNGVLNDKVVRSNIDRALNHMLDYTDKEIIYSIFQSDYDGRKISLKYFVDLCVHYLEKQRYCYLNY